MTSIVTPSAQLTHSVVNHEPPVPSQNRGSTRANLQPLPRSYRSGQAMMRVEQAKATRCEIPWWHRTVGDPDALVVGIHPPPAIVTRGVLRRGAGKKGPVE